jgi:nucleoside-diphosphate-sugar epimerase
MRGNLSWQEAIPRAIADFLVVHFSLIGAIVISVVYQVARGSGFEAHQLIMQFEQYYLRFFWFLSPIFPVTFVLFGFYTHTRSYSGKRKNLTILKGVISAALLFLGANWLVGDSVVGKSVALPFVVLASLGLCLSRYLTNYIKKRFEVRPRDIHPTPHGKNHVLVVGGAGYIGSLLVEKLLGLGYRVRVLDALFYGSEPLLPVRNHPAFQLMVGDCRNMQDVVRAVRGVDAIVDLAAIVGDPACDQAQEAALEINYGATRMLIEVAKGHGIERFLFASSCSVYGANDHEVDERSELNPISLYARTKVDSERALLSAGSDGFHPTILRFATIFGLGYRPRFDLLVNLLSAKANQDGKITVYNGQQWRPFLHVRDVVEAIVKVLEAPVQLVSREIFNVGDSHLNLTLQQVSEIVREVFVGTSIEQVANSDLRNYRVNFDKIHNRLSFNATCSIRDGIKELKDAFEGRLILDYKDVRYHNQRYLQAVGVLKNKNEIDALLMAAFAHAT